jgi:antitoxin component YwqK of YwqJK toxin-antitoxin module
MGLNWKYQDKDFTEDLIGDNYGFVYQITNLTNGRKYIGKKFFYSAKTKQVKGKKKKIKVPSDWQTYYGSSAELSKDVLQLGHEQFNREILHLCLSKGDCGYLEAKEQFINGALESDEYYNTWIMVRVRKSHLKGINVRLSTKTEK